jgi:hypothetical protein
MLPGAVALLFALAAAPAAAADSLVEDDISRLVNDYYYAIGESRLEEAMGFYHEDSPQVDSTREELAFGRSAYLQRTSTLRLDLVQTDGQRAVVRAAHRHLRIAGIKFMETYTEAEYTLRRQGDAWKIWSREERRVSRRASPERNPANVPQSLVEE